MDVQGLIEQADEALADGDLKTAQRAGEALLAARHTYGFEVLARMHQQHGDLQKAIEVIEDGVKKAPRAWPLRLLQGELLSDNSEYDAALAAYDAVLSIDGADEDAAHINAAIVLHRAGRYEEALARLDSAPGESDDTVFAAARIRADILNILERPDEAIAAAEEGLARVSDDVPTSDVAELYAAMAKSALMKGDRDEALRRAKEAVALDDHEVARLIVREIQGR